MTGCEDNEGDLGFRWSDQLIIAPLFNCVYYISIIGPTPKLPSQLEKYSDFTQEKETFAMNSDPKRKSHEYGLV